MLEFTSAGAYTRFASGGTDDRGRYSIEGGAINFFSDVDPRLSSAVPFESPNDDTLTFILYVPTRLEIEWTRSDRKPFFPTVEIDGRRVPSALPDLMTATLAFQAKRWQADALPTWIEVEARRNGRYGLVPGRVRLAQSDT